MFPQPIWMKANVAIGLGLMHSSILLDTATPAIIRGSHKSLEEAIIERIKEVDGELAHDTFQF